MFFQLPFFLFSQDIEYSKQNISNTMTDTAAHREMCWKCFRPKKNCYCQFIQPFHTHTRFVLLMHPKEAVDKNLLFESMSSTQLPSNTVVCGLRMSANILCPNDTATIPLYPLPIKYRILNNNLIVKGGVGFKMV